MNLCRAVCCCCGVYGVAFTLIVSIGFLTIRSRVPPRAFVQDACGNDVAEDIRILDGFPFKCGWQQLRPEGFGDSAYVPYAFIQPNASWCWSNSGFVGRSGFVADGLLVDTLTDPALTADMLTWLGKVKGLGGPNPIGALIFTHPDVDHILGNQAIPLDVPRLGTKEAQKEVTAQKGVVPSLLLALSVGHFIWEAAQLVGPSLLLTAAPLALEGAMLKLLGWARFQSFMAKFNLVDLDTERLPQFTKFLESGAEVNVRGKTLPATFMHFGPIHSKSDSVLLLPESRVVFTGDLLFIGIAPVMWAGPAKAWIAALDKLLSMTGEDWLFVPGHGPVTDAEGVRSVRRFLEYVDSGVTEACTEFPLADEASDEACAERVLEKMPAGLRGEFKEPERVMICAAIERMARRASGPAPLELQHKVKYTSKMGEYAVLKDHTPRASTADEHVAHPHLFTTSLMQAFFNALEPATTNATNWPKIHEL